MVGFRTPSAGGAAPSRLFGQNISPLDMGGLRDFVLAPAPAGGGVALIVTMNLDHVVQLRRNAAFQAAYASAAAVSLDGFPVWAWARLRGLNRQRCPGADLLPLIVSGFDPGAHRPFFVVSREGVGRALVDRLERDHPGLSVDFQCPPHGFETDAQASEALIDAINRHRTTHLIFGLGAPKSEIFINRRRSSLGDLKAMCVGSAPDFLVGAVPRAPAAMRAVGLEWMYRLALDPKRLARRYLWDSWSVLPALLDDLRDAGARPAGGDPRAHDAPKLA